MSHFIPVRPTFILRGDSEVDAVMAGAQVTVSRDREREVERENLNMCFHSHFMDGKLRLVEISSLF